MAAIEDESNNISSATAEVDSFTVSGSQAHSEVALSGQPTVQLAELENQDGANNEFTVTTVGEGGGSDQGLSELLDSSSKGDGCQEVISQILGTEVLSEHNIITSYVHTRENVKTAVSTESTAVSGVQALTPTTTIIYVQPDGSFVESSGLSAEEQQQLIEQLAKQQLVQVTGNEAARIFEQSQVSKSVTTPQQSVVSGTLAPIEVHQVIEQVSKSQQAAVRKEQIVRTATPQVVQRTVAGHPTSFITLEPGNLITAGGQLTTTIQPQPLTIVQNASQQLQNVSKHVTLQQSQNGAQLIQKKPVETVQIQVQIPQKQEIKGRQTVPLRVIQPQSLQVNQPMVKVSTVGTVSSPQIIHITPVAGQQQYFLQNPGEPPIQLLLQKPAPVVSNFVPVVHKVSAPASAKGPTAKPSVPAPAPAPSAPAAATAPAPARSSTATKETKERQRSKNRPKKPQKIQTRSGRVSRPPKHKVKDYKFIKNEDLADSHQSDSDDYSEISVEDEEGEEGKKNVSDVNLALNNRAFKCETCDKAYVGHAGLNRHYKLNPTHATKQPSPEQTETKSLDSTEQTAGTESTSTPVTSDSAKLPLTQKAQVEPSGAGQAHGRGRPRGPGRPGRPRRVGRPPKRGRPGRPPKHHGAGSLEQQAQRRRARLKEAMQQCEDDELIEVALPRLAKAMTLWEFVLMKVEKQHSSKPQFPDVYREFEQLHSQVKKMAQEHFTGAAQPALQVHDMEVLKSLGVQLNMMKPLNTALGQKSQENQATKNVRHLENTKMLPPAKRFKMENRPGETNGYQVNQNGIEKEQKEETSSALRKTQTRPENPSPSPATAEKDTAPSSSEGVVALETGIHPLEAEGDKAQEVPDAEMSEVFSIGGPMDIADQMKELEQALGSDLDREYKSASHGLKQQPHPEENCDPAQTSDPKQPVAAGDGTETQSTQPSVQEGHQEQQIYIQTEEGLILHQASDLASEGIVIVDGPDGATMHIQAPEGVPLETVHAMLGIETEGQVAGVQMPQSLQ
ncbi:zinc finger protein 839 [Chanos chanos]|uniref:Zinc finger protein 839 n=1 Tax=Chanos chanos TaxID=29144 RepID=A0A6J2WBF8_CHACN|nr:zinc finger protein 839 [Chanos chanos]